MDTEELEEIAFHQKNGRPETTKGPYYHKAWWESYKGAVKGILGGIVIGGLIGAGAGGALIGALTLASIDVAGYAVAILASTTLFGMYEGKEKFEKVGIASGAVAATSEVSEVRMKEYIRDKFTDLTNELREMKAAMAGKKSVETLQTAPAIPDNAAIFDESDFRSTHTEGHGRPEEKKLVFWKVASIGGLVGAAVAAVATFAAGGEPLHQLAEFVGMGGSVIGEAAAGGALVTTGALLGASFGINRDVFRKIFDVTDCWFMGIANGKCTTEDIAVAHGQKPVNLEPHQPHTHNAPSEPKAVKTIAAQTTIPSATISDSMIAQQQNISHADKLMAERARNALLSMDHTTAARN